MIEHNDNNRCNFDKFITKKIVFSYLSVYSIHHNLKIRSLVVFLLKYFVVSIFTLKSLFYCMLNFSYIYFLMV